MTGINKVINKVIKKAAVFVIYWGITGSFACVMHAVIADTETGKKAASELLFEETAVSQLAGGKQKISGVSESDSGKEEAVVRKQVALSFDDGPHPIYTELLLDGLAERNVKAAFFVVGKNISKNEHLISRMYQEGHVIGNHTYDHVKLSELSDAEACAQVEKTNRRIYEITGTHIEYVRPPFGEWDHSMECSFTMIPVFWDVDPLDWTTKNQDQIVRHVLETAEDGDIILLHDYYKSSVDAALRIIDELQRQGYEFVTIDRIILE